MGSEFQSPISGTISALNGEVDLTSPNSGTSIVQVTGTWVGTLEVQGSNNGTDYFSIYAYNDSTKLFEDSIDSNSVYTVNTNGFQFIKIIATAWTSGTATIDVYGSDETSLVKTDSTLRGATDGTQIGNEGDGLNIINQTPGARNQVDTNNSTTTPLGSSASFIGTATEILPFTSLTIILYSDQDSAVNGMKFQFSTDGTNWDESLNYNLTGGSARRFTFAVKARYFRINYTNDSVAQTEFRVQTILQDSFPGNPVLRVGDSITDDRSANLVKSVITGLNENDQFVNIKADNQDALKVSSVITDKEGNDVSISNFSELRTAQRTIDIQGKYIYNISSALYNTTTANGGFITNSNSQAQLQTGTNSAGKAELQTKRYINYRVSEATEYSTTVRFPFVTGTVGSQVGVANSRAILGAFVDGENGLHVGFINGNQFSVTYLTEGTETTVTQGSFSEDQLDGTTVTKGVTSRYAPDFTKIQIIRVTYSWHGAATINWQIQTPEEEWITFHRSLFINTIITPSIGSPFLPITALVENTGNTTDIELDVQAQQASYIGEANITSQSVSFAADHVKSISTETPIISLRNLSTFNSKTNGIRSIFETISAASDGNKPVRIRAYIDATLTGASFTDVLSNISCSQIDTSATAFSSSTPEVAYVTLGKVDSYNDIVQALDLELQPGQTITFTAESASSNEVTIGFRWRELQ